MWWPFRNRSAENDAGSCKAPDKPRPVLRIAFAGHRPKRLHGKRGLQERQNREDEITAALKILFGSFERAMTDQSAEWRDQYAPLDGALLRLVSGAAVGADHLAIRAVDQLRHAPALPDDAVRPLEEADTKPDEAKTPPRRWEICTLLPCERELFELDARGDYVEHRDPDSNELATLNGQWPRRLSPAEASFWDDLLKLPDRLTVLPASWRQHTPHESGSAVPELDPAIRSIPRPIVEGGAKWVLDHTPAAEFLLREADVLIVLWDLLGANGPGGTPDLAAQAHEAGIPVLVINPNDTKLVARRLQGTTRPAQEFETRHWFTGVQSGRCEPAEVNAEHVRSIVEKRLALAEEAHAQHRRQVTYGTFLADKSGVAANETTYNRLVRILRWLAPPSTPGAAEVAGSGQAAGGKNPAVRLKDFFLRQWRRIDDWLAAAGRNGAPQGANARQADNGQRRRWEQQLRPQPNSARRVPAGHQSSPGTGAPDDGATGHSAARRDRHRSQQETLLDVVQPRYARVEELAARYGAAYRNSYTQLHLLAAVAACIAVVGLALALWGANIWIKVALAVLELAVIWCIWRLFRDSQQRQYHGKFLDYQALAESLRELRSLSTLSELPRSIGPGQGPGLRWWQWYVRATAREIGPPDGELLPEWHRTVIQGLLDHELPEQLEYQTRQLEANEHLEHAAHRLGSIFLLITVIAIIAIIGLALLSALFHWPGHDTTKALLPAFGLLTAIPPIVGAAVLGIVQTADFEARASQARRMITRIEHQRQVLAAELQRQGHDATRRALVATVRLASSDLEAFLTTYSNRPLVMPS